MPEKPAEAVGVLGKNLREHRERRGWSPSELARRAGVDPSYIWRIERGIIANPSAVKLDAIAAALGVPPEELQPMTPRTVPKDEFDRKILTLSHEIPGFRAEFHGDFTRASLIRMARRLLEYAEQQTPHDQQANEQ